MRTSDLTVRWRFLTGSGLVALLAATVVWSAPPEESKPGEGASETVSKPSDLPADAVDLTDKVEVTVNGDLRSSSRKAHSASITVKNISEEDLQGPIIVIVDGTGIDALELIQTDGKLSDDRPYVEIVKDSAELKAGKSLRPQKLSFETEESLTAEVRGQFDLKVRICRLEPGLANADSAADDADKIEGKSYGWKQFDKVAATQEKWTVPLIKNGQGQVYGTAVSENDKGELVVTVYTQRSGTDDIVPDTIDGIPVEIQTIGQMFRAGPATNDLIYPNGRPRKANRGNENDFAPVPDEGPGTGEETNPSDTTQATPLPVTIDPTLRFNRPVPIGVSIANVDRLLDLPPENSLCYSGTLGCRCVDALGDEYILTNLHVGGAFLFPDPDSPVAMLAGIGERIVQPSTGDMVNFCTVDANNVIGQIADFETIFLFDDEDLALLFPHIMDASIALANPGAVDFAPPADGYQTVKRDVINRPYIGMPAQKYGRTTTYTNGVVTGMNAATLVGYADNGVAFFVRQITIANLTAFGQAFGGPGDSGSLIVARKPGSDIDGQPLGLLFAGGPRGAIDITIANPIGPILVRFGLQVDDGQGAPFQAGGSGTMGGAIAPTSPPSHF